jgi:murein L,D-transpeptidase YcbB/YkuD
VGKQLPSIVVAMLVTAVVGCASPSSHEIAQSVRQILSGKPIANVPSPVWNDVRRFYEPSSGAPVWVNHRGATKNAIHALDVLRSAPSHGLQSNDYRVDDLRQSAEAIRKMYARAPERTRQIGELEVGLTAALLTLARDVALGRAELLRTPSWKPLRPAPDFVATLRAARAGRLSAWLDSVRPKHREYAALQKALGELRAERETTPGEPEIDARIRVVELNLNRWRLLPDDLGERHFIVNIPQFHLFAREAGKNVLDMRVVVGRPGDNTPIFSDDMESVVFSPYWNIPERIAQNETAPAVMRDSDYLDRQNIEVLRASSRGLEPIGADEVDWEDPSALKKVVLRQQPGPGNALGSVKFLFPNSYDVYMHDTPAGRLFARPSRAFSHGCVRVAEPEALARYLLRDQPEWDDGRISQAMASGTERHVRLTRKIPVHIVYFTAWVDDHGRLQFSPDVYKYDRLALQ